MVQAIRRGRVPQEDALHLVGVVVRHLRVVAHDVAVGGVGDEDELALGEGLEDALEEVFADGEGGADVGEVEGPRVEGAEGVGVVDEGHVLPGRLLGERGQVVEMGVCERSRPVAVDVRHVHPGHEGLGEGVVEAVFRVVDLRDAEDVVDVGDDGQPGGGDEVGGGVAAGCALHLLMEDLDLGCAVAGSETGVVELHETVDVAFGRGGGWVGDHLGAALGADGAAIGALGRRGGEREGDVLLSLLDNIDFGGDVAGLRRVGRVQFVDRGADQEAVGEVVEFGLGDVGLFVDVCAEAEVPALVGPVGVVPVVSGVSFWT